MIQQGFGYQGNQSKPNAESGNYLTLYYYLCIPEDELDDYYY